MNDIELNQEAVDLRIDNIEKAAILMLSMGEEAAAQIFKRLNRDEVQALGQTMARLHNVSTTEAKWILQQFFVQYKKQSGISGASRLYLERTLDLALGNKFSRDFLDNLYGDSIREELQMLQWIPSETLARFFKTEHVQLQAVMLAFLPSGTSSEVLSYYPEETHDDLMFRIANLKEVSERVIEEVRHAAERCLNFFASQVGARVDGIKQVAEMINRYQGDRNALIAKLKDHDPDLITEIEKNMFDFFTLQRQTAEVLAQLLQEIPQETLAVALKGVDANFKKKILGALPKRMAQSLETMLMAPGTSSLSKVEQARAEIMQTVREMMEQGDMEYQLYEEPVVS